MSLYKILMATSLVVGIVEVGLLGSLVIYTEQIARDSSGCVMPVEKGLLIQQY